jgi:hypothetical protein
MKIFAENVRKTFLQNLYFTILVTLTRTRLRKFVNIHPGVIFWMEYKPTRYAIEIITDRKSFNLYDSPHMLTLILAKSFSASQNQCQLRHSQKNLRKT